MFGIVLEICILQWNSLGNAFAGKTKDSVTRPVDEYTADGPIRSFFFSRCVLYTIFSNYLSPSELSPPPWEWLYNLLFMFTGDPVAERWVLSSHELLGPWI